MIQLEVISNNIIVELNGQTTDVIIELQPLLPATGSGGGATNLGYISNINNGVVTSDTGTDAIIPLAGLVNAGLISASEKALINTAIQPNDLPTIPTKTSDLINDGEDGVNLFITSNDLPTPLGYTPENVANKTVDLGNPDNTKYPTTLAVQLALNNYVPKPLINATLPLDPTNTLIVGQDGMFKKVAVSEISSGASKFEFISDNVPNTPVTSASYITIKEYTIGKLSELTAIQLYVNRARNQTATAVTFRYRIVDSLNNIVFAVDDALTGGTAFYGNSFRFYLAVEQATNQLKYATINGNGDINAFTAYQKTSFNPGETYRLQVGGAGTGFFTEQVLINLYKI